MIREMLAALSRLASTFRRRTLDREFDDEFAAHLDLLTDRKVRGGLLRHEARRQAILQMGGLNATRDLHRETRGLPPVERCLEACRASGRDLVHAGRALAKARAFTLVCVVSLGIGMGTVIGLLIVLRTYGPPGGFDPDGMVELLVTLDGPLQAERGESVMETWSYPDFADLHEAETGVAIVGWAEGHSAVRLADLDSRFPRMRVPTMYVSEDYFGTIGVTLTGPGFEATGQEDTTQPVVILTDEFWEERLDYDPDVLGGTVTLNGVPHVVVGIAPPWFQHHLGVSGGRAVGDRVVDRPPLAAGAETGCADVPHLRRPLSGHQPHVRPAAGGSLQPSGPGIWPEG